MENIYSIGQAVHTAEVEMVLLLDRQTVIVLLIASNTLLVFVGPQIL